MQRLSYPSETLLSNIINRNIIVLSFKYYPRKPLGRRPSIARIPTVIFVSISGAGRREGGRGNRKQCRRRCRDRRCRPPVGFCCAIRRREIDSSSLGKHLCSVERLHCDCDCVLLFTSSFSPFVTWESGHSFPFPNGSLVIILVMVMRRRTDGRIWGRGRRGRRDAGYVFAREGRGKLIAC